MPNRNEFVLAEHVYISGIDAPDSPGYTTITVTTAGQHVRIPCLVKTAVRIATTEAAKERYELVLVPAGGRGRRPVAGLTPRDD